MFLWVAFSVLTLIYLGFSILLFLRSNHKCIISRSPTILQVAHWCNYIELVFSLVILNTSELSLTNKSQLVYWLIETMMIVPHYLMVYSYLVRGYRLYLVFNLGAALDSSYFYRNRHRISQRSTILLLCKLIAPVFLFCLIIVLMLSFNDNSIKLYNKNTNGERTQVHYMVSSLFSFFLEISLLIMTDFIKVLDDEYQMTKEIVAVAIVLNATPVISLFAHLYTDWAYAYVVINLLLMLITSVTPVVLSYTQQTTYQILSVELLSSLELVLQQKITLNAFEEFLKESGGDGHLEIYLGCDCFQELKNKEIGEKTIEKAEKLAISPAFFDIKKVDLDDENSLNPLMNYCYKILNQDFFPMFSSSRQYKKLEKVINRQEIFENRIAESSFLPSRSMTQIREDMKSMINFYNH